MLITLMFMLFNEMKQQTGLFQTVEARARCFVLLLFSQNVCEVQTALA